MPFLPSKIVGKSLYVKVCFGLNTMLGLSTQFGACCRIQKLIIITIQPSVCKSNFKKCSLHFALFKLLVVGNGLYQMYSVIMVIIPKY